MASASWEMSSPCNSLSPAATKQPKQQAGWPGHPRVRATPVPAGPQRSSSRFTISAALAWHIWVTKGACFGQIQRHGLKMTSLICDCSSRLAGRFGSAGVTFPAVVTRTMDHRWTLAHSKPCSAINLSFCKEDSKIHTYQPSYQSALVQAGLLVCSLVSDFFLYNVILLFINVLYPGLSEC